MIVSTIAFLLAQGTPKLGIGDKAPPLTFGSAIKGDPVRSFNRSKVTVVEFWATWCKPCVAFAPHLSELTSQYKDKVDVVSVSVFEQDYSKVAPFVKEMGDRMSYPIAIDKVDAKGNGFMQKHWLEAANQNSIPVAFIVDTDGRIAWIGNPDGMDSVLRSVVEGKWNAKAYRNKFDAAVRDDQASTQLLSEGFHLITSTVRNHRFKETLAWIKQNRAKYDGPDTQASLDDLVRLLTPFAAGDYSAALKIAEVDPKNSLSWSYFRFMYLIARIDALQSLKREEWRDVAAKVIEEGNPNYMMHLVDALTLPDSKLAVKDSGIALRAANKLAGYAREPMFLKRLAWAHYAAGDITNAKAVLDEAFRGMEAEKKRNPKYYDGMLRELKEAKAHFDKPKPSKKGL